MRLLTTVKSENEARTLGDALFADGCADHGQRDP